MSLLNEAQFVGAAVLVSLGLLGLHVPLMSEALADQVIFLECGRGTYNLPLQFNPSLYVRAIVDTGTSHITVTQEVLQSLVNDGRLTPSDWLPSVQVSSGDGRQLIAPQVRIRSLRIGGYELNNVVASITPRRNPVLLGQAALQRFGRYTLDTSSGMLILPD